MNEWKKTFQHNTEKKKKQKKKKRKKIEIKMKIQMKSAGHNIYSRTRYNLPHI